MGEIVVDIPASLPSLPSEETTFDVPGPLRLWFSTGAPHAGTVLALSPLAFFVSIFLMVFIVETTELIAAIALFLLVLFVIFVTMLLAFATLIGRRTRSRHVREATLHYAPRLQSAKDWFVRGDITEGEYEQIRAVIEPSTTEKAPAAVVASTATTLRVFSLVFTIVAAVLVPFNVVLIAEGLDYLDAEGLLLVFSILMVDVAAVFLIVTSWRTAKTAGQVAKAMQVQTSKRIDAHEAEILKAARGRRVGASGSAAPYGGGPSFRSYTGR